MGSIKYLYPTQFPLILDGIDQPCPDPCASEYPGVHSRTDNPGAFVSRGDYDNFLALINETRQLPMDLAIELCGLPLEQTAEFSSLGSYGSVGRACSVTRGQMKSDRRHLGQIEEIREGVRLKYKQTKT